MDPAAALSGHADHDFAIQMAAHHEVLSRQILPLQDAFSILPDQIFEGPSLLLALCPSLSPQGPFRLLRIFSCVFLFERPQVWHCYLCPAWLLP